MTDTSATGIVRRKKAERYRETFTPVVLWLEDIQDKRSAAAHGRRKHDGDDILQTFELLRKVLLEIIRNGEMPSKAGLEAKLFGC